MLTGTETVTPSGIRVVVLAATPDPEKLVWQAAHQDVTPNLSADDSVPASHGEAIVKRLLQRGHFGPFEHPHITFNIGGISRACMAQLTRHRVGISFDVQSLRYTTVDLDLEAVRAPEGLKFVDEHLVLPPYLRDDPEKPVKVVERGRSPRRIQEPKTALERIRMAYATALRDYFQLISMGVPAEDARMVLPIGLRINLVMTVNARSLMHILDMRLPPNAQWEIRELCGALLDLAELWMPHTFEWYRENRAGKHMLAP